MKMILINDGSFFVLLIIRFKSDFERFYEFKFLYSYRKKWTSCRKKFYIFFFGVWDDLNKIAKVGV